MTSYNLRELDFNHNREIFTSVISSLSSYYNKIEVLNLSGCGPVSDSDIECMNIFLKKSTTLHDLSLRGIDLGSLKKKSFKTFLEGVSANSSLKRLNLAKNKIYKHA